MNKDEHGGQDFAGERGKKLAPIEDGSAIASSTQLEIGTSRLSVGQIHRMVQTFTPFKRDLVNAIGFGGLLCLPNLPKLNLRFSLWLLNQVDVDKLALVVDDNNMIRFFDEDVERIFGIPCGLRKVDGPDASITHDAVSFMRSALGLLDKDSHSLKRVESFLCRDISPDSSRLEQECFQAAFVIYSMGHLLAPSVKHDYVTVDFWGALKNADHIVHYNWCNYVIRSVIEAARKVQRACPTKGPIQIPGCHLFLQVFFLDNMDVGCYKLAHNVFPRISEFDNERIKIMIQKSVCCRGGGDEMFAYVRARTAESVCYTRRKIERSMSRGEPVTPIWRVGNKATISNSAPPSMVENHEAYAQPGNDGTLAGSERDAPGIVRYCTNSDIDKSDFLRPTGLFDYFKLNYPTIIGSEIVDLLKRHNAMCVKHYVEHQRAMIRENINLAESLVEVLGEDRIRQIGRSRESSGFKTPVVHNKHGSGVLVSQQLKFEESEGESSGLRRKNADKQPLSTDSQSKRIRITRSTEAADIGNQRATAGSQSVSSARTTSVNARDDIPSFDLGIDDDDHMDITSQDNAAHIGADTLTLSPAPKLVAKSKQSPRSANKGFSDLLIGEMLLLQDEKRTTQSGKVLFGDATPSPACKRKLETGDFAPNPFYNGHIHSRPMPENVMSLDVWVTSQCVKDIERPWIIHHYPRHIELTGRDIKDQLLGMERMDPDVLALLVRRFGQLDGCMVTGNADLRWRHFLEPDFAIFGLAGSDVGQLLSVQNQFIGDGVTYNLARAELIIVPARLIDGWVCYAWDMKKKLIHVMDPLFLTGVSDERRSIHEDVTAVLHGCLGRCLRLFFEDWVTSDTPWTRLFPMLGRKDFTEQQSGVVAAYLARNYDGKRVEIPLDEERLREAQGRMLFDLLQLEGNMATLPEGVAIAMRRFS